MRDLLAQWFDSNVSPSTTNDLDRIDWYRIVPFIALHLGCLAVFWVGVSSVAASVALLAYLVRMFAITAFYHRYFSHRAFRTSRALQFCGALLGATATQRGALWWSGVHRQHHRNADLPNDPHTPQHGFLRAHLGWFLTRRYFRVEGNLTRDWQRFPELRWLDRFDSAVPILFALGMYGLGAWLESVRPAWGTNGVQMLVWGYCISTVALCHATFCINSLAHRFGERRFATSDDSRNNRWLALLTLGEGWHNNHHRFATAARQGFFRGEPDATHAVLRVMERCGLVWDLRAVPEHVLAEGRPR